MPEPVMDRRDATGDGFEDDGGERADGSGDGEDQGPDDERREEQGGDVHAVVED